jgi:hypothetical protein
MEDNKIWILAKRPNRNIEPAEIIILEEQLEPFGKPSFARGRSAGATRNGVEEFRHGRGTS